MSAGLLVAAAMMLPAEMLSEIINIIAVVSLNFFVMFPPRNRNAGVFIFRLYKSFCLLCDVAVPLIVIGSKS